MSKEKENIIDNKELEENIAENDENLQEEVNEEETTAELSQMKKSTS